MVKNDVLSFAFCYARYSKGTEELTGFGIKNSLILHFLTKKYLHSLRMKTMKLSILIPTNLWDILWVKA